MNDYSQYKPMDFMVLMDEKFEDSVGRIKRSDIEWGTWSREMNLEIRQRLEMENANKVLYGLIFAYWTTLSQLLDLIYNCKGLKGFFLEKKIKNKTQEALDIREKVSEGC